MNLTLNLLDLKGIDTKNGLLKLKKETQLMKKKGAIWLVDDHEPTELYPFLIQQELHFQTFIISKNEYRLFISKNEENRN